MGEVVPLFPVSKRDAESLGDGEYREFNVTISHCSERGLSALVLDPQRIVFVSRNRERVLQVANELVEVLYDRAGATAVWVNILVDRPG